MLLIVTIAIILIVSYLVSQVRKPANFPPGPSWLPFVGSLPELRKLSRELGGQHLGLLELAKKYNTNVLGLKLGNDLVISVSSYATVREVLTGEEYEGRPDNFFIKLRCMGTRRGITCADGELWAIQRNFVVKHLRNLGFGKKPMETMIKEEIAALLPNLKKTCNGQRLGKILAPAVINILWSLTTGSRLSTGQLDQLLDLLELRSKAFDLAGGTLSQHPWLRFLAPEKSGFNLIQKMNAELQNLFLETITKHQKDWSEGRSDDLIYSFITEMKTANGHPTSFTSEQLVIVCLDLFIGGAQTTSNTLDFAFLMMILHPDVQTRVQANIDESFEGQDNLDYSGRNKIPYVEAVLLEVERFCHVVPVCGPRRVLVDTILEGYRIPKETTVLINLYSVHNDTEFWKDPENFRPERFLNENGLLLPQERLVPFGLGRRRCLGEALARNCIFTFFVEIMRRYKVALVPGEKFPTGKPLPGITLSPESYKARFIER